MMRRACTRAALGGLALAAVVVLAPVALAQDGLLSLDAQAGIGYSTAPFLVADGGGSAYSELMISPGYTLYDQAGEVGVSAHYRRVDYFRGFGGNDGYGGDLRAQRRISPLLNLHGNVAYESSISGQTALGAPALVDPTLPFQPPFVVGGPDISVIGRRVRQRNINGGVGASWQLSSRDSATTNFTYGRSSYDDVGGLISSRTLGVSVGYSRALSERSSIGLQGSGSWVNFGRPGETSSFYQPQVTYSRKVGTKLSLTAAAGVILISSRTPAGTFNTTGFSGSLSACHARGERSSLCLNASSDAQSTAFGNISRRLTASGYYSYRLSESDFFTLGADYSRLSQVAREIPFPDTDYFGGSASIEHGIRQKLFVGISAGYHVANSSAGNLPSDLNARVYARTRLGRTR